MKHIINILLHSLLMCYTQSYALRGFTLQSPLMPYAATAWGMYYDSTNNKIWFFSPRICNAGDCSQGNEVISYDVVNNSFTIEAPTPESMYTLESSTSAVYNGNHIYFNDGVNFVLGSFNIVTKEWKRPFQIMPLEVYGACLVSDSRYIYVIGGKDRTNAPVNYLQIFDTHDSKWLSETNSLQSNHAFSACELHNGTIYVFGGYHAGGNLGISKIIEMIFVGSGDDVAINAATQTWIVLSDVITTGMSLSSVICNSIDKSIIYLFGGGNTWSSTYDTVEMFDMNTHSVSKVNPVFTMNIDRAGHSAICIDNFIYVFGGRKYIYEGGGKETTNTWEKSNMLYYVAPTEAATTSTTTTTPSTTTNTSSFQTVESSDIEHVILATHCNCSDELVSDKCKKSKNPELTYLFAFISLFVVSVIINIILFIRLRGELQQDIGNEGKIEEKRVFGHVADTNV